MRDPDWFPNGHVLGDPQVLAMLHFFHPAHGGRNTRVNKYHYRFSLWFDKCRAVTAQATLPVETLWPGESSSANLWLYRVDLASEMYRGQAFTIREGDNIVGVGYVTSIY